MPLTPINVPLRIEGQDATGPAVRGLNNVARAGERAQAAIGGVGVTANQMSRAMDNARRAAFRYTYYALIALRAGQMLLAAGMQRFFIEPTREAEEAIVRFAALSDEARGRIEEITEAAIEFAMRTPYAIADAAKAMENLYRTGRSVKEAMEEAYDAANLAVISGRELATEATFLGEIMNVFARTGITATQVVDELAYAMTQSKYTIPELQAALENAMSVAIGFNQTFEQTIALITAFGRAGVPARQAGNMLRRIFARMGMPKVNEFFMTLTEAWNEMNAAAIEAGKTLPAQLYTAEGKFGDLSRAVIASAEVLEKWRKEAAEQGRGEEYLMFLQQLLYETFGIRQIMPFLALSTLRYLGKEGVEAYDALLKAIREATGYSEKYLKDLMATYSVAQMQFTSSLRFFQITFGTPMLQVLNPSLRILTEAINLVARLAAMVPTFRDVASIILITASYGSLFAGALGMAWAVLQLMKVRLLDIGEYIQDLAKSGANISMIVRGISRETALAMHPLQLGKAAIFGGIVGPLKIALALVTLIGLGVLAWKKNLGGLRDLLVEPFSKLRDELIDTGSLAKRIAESTRHTLLETPAWREFWTAAFGGRARTSYEAGLRVARRGRIREGVFMAPGIEIPRRGTFFTALSAYVGGFLKMFTFGLKALGATLKVVGTILRGFFTGLAWVFGLGDTAKGFERLGKAMGYIASTAVLGLLIWSIQQLGMAAYKTGRFILGIALKGIRFLDTAYARGLRILYKATVQIPLRFLSFLLEIPQFGFRPAFRRFLYEAFGIRWMPGVLRRMLTGLRGRTFRFEVVRVFQTIFRDFKEMKQVIIQAIPHLKKAFDLLFTFWWKIPMMAQEKLPGVKRAVGRIIGKFLTFLFYPILAPLRGYFHEQARRGRYALWVGALSKRLFEYLYGIPYQFGRDRYGRFRRTTAWERTIFTAPAWKRPFVAIKLLLMSLIGRVTRILRLQEILTLLKKREFLKNVGERLCTLVKSFWDWLSGLLPTLLAFLGISKITGGGRGAGGVAERGLATYGAARAAKGIIDWIKGTRFGRLVSRIGGGLKTVFWDYLIQPAWRYIAKPTIAALGWLTRSVIGLPGLLAGAIVTAWSVPGNLGEMEALRNLRRMYDYETQVLSPQGFAGFTGPAVERPTLTIQNLNFAFSPTLELTDGTPEEKARQIIELVRLQLSNVLRDLQDSQLELYMRGSENPLNFSDLSLTYTPASPLPDWEMGSRREGD